MVAATLQTGAGRRLRTVRRREFCAGSSRHLAGAPPGARLGAVRIVALLTVPCAVALLFALAASQFAGGHAKHPVSVPARAIVWNNRVFFDREELAKWLRSRGASYDVWAAHHPQRTGATVPKVPPAKQTSRWHLPSRHTVLVGVGAAGIVVVGALALMLLGRLGRFLRGRELPQLNLPTRRHEETYLTPMGGALLLERAPEKPESFRLRRRLDVGFALAASSLGVGVALVLPHL